MPDFSFDGLMTKLAGVAGALVSMQFLQGTFWSRLTMAGAGALLSYYAAPYASVKTALPEGLAGFLVGFFGMAVVSKLWEWLQAAPIGEWMTHAVRSVWHRWFPPAPTPPADDKGA